MSEFEKAKLFKKAFDLLDKADAILNDLDAKLKQSELNNKKAA